VLNFIHSCSVMFTNENAMKNILLILSHDLVFGNLAGLIVARGMNTALNAAVEQDVLTL